jgi:eukaryotic-like serine/threonine-protein kinase
VGMTLEDVAPDGRVLVSVDTERVAMATAPRDGKAVDVSWRDWTLAKDISRDGKSVLFEDASEASGPYYSLGIRNLDGTPPISLGEGSGGGLSPDGKWAISVLTGSMQRVTLVPIGPGQPRTIATPGLERIASGNVHFLGDGKHITLNANEPGHPARMYLVDFEGGKPIPITPEGVTDGLISPDGQFIVRTSAAGVGVYPTAGGAPRIVPNLESGFLPILWSEDNSAVYGYVRDQILAKVYKINLVTGEKTLIQELHPETAVGAVYVAPVVMTRDGSRFAYSFYQVSSQLYLISGLR